MCGLSFYPRSLELDPEIIVQQLNHRGPNGSGVFMDEHQVLVHTRLAIIDPESRSNQPMRDPSGRYVLIFNGEIYNYKELRERLSYPFSTQSDTELLLALLIKYGYEACNLIEGMFAFAFYDTLEKICILGRDRLGKKPLYYTEQGEQISAASEVRTLLYLYPHLGQSTPQQISNWLTWQSIPGEQSILPGIKQVRPGSCLILKEGRIQSYAIYWSIESYLQADYLQNQSTRAKDELQRELRHLCQKAVQKRLMADVPFAIFLSGGIDSSLITALAAAEERELHTLSLVFKQEQYNEGPFAQRMAQRYHTKHHEIEVNGADMLQAVQHSLQAMDHPSVDGVNTYLISKAAREHGFAMALSGIGGDEWFLGYNYFQEQAIWEQRANWPVGRIPKSFLPIRLRKAAQIIEAQNQYQRGSFAVQRILWSSFTLQHEFKLPAPSIMPHSDLPIMGFEHAQDSIAEWKYYTQPILLRDADQFGMAHGVEIRAPFMDHHLIEFALRLPNAQKPYGKKLLTDTFSDLLPREIYERPKQGFVLPYEHWMRGELKDYCSQHMHSFCQRIGAKKPLKHWDSFLKGSRSVSYSRWWGIITLEAWLQRNKIGLK